MPSTRSTRMQGLQSPASKSRHSARSGRSSKAPALKEVKGEADVETDDDVDETLLADEPSSAYVFEGVKYANYQEMVNAKRKRNQDVLQGLGFHGNGMQHLKPVKARTGASQRGIKKQKTTKEVLPKRKSSRISGEKSSLVALDYYVQSWDRNMSTVLVEGDKKDDSQSEEEEVRHFNGRVNDGSDLTLADAIDLNDRKWVKDGSLDNAKKLRNDLQDLCATKTKAVAAKSPTSVISSSMDLDEDNVAGMLNDLCIDKEEWVAKVTPDRIYSVAAHPSESKLIACAGDKQGYIGLWDVNSHAPEGVTSNQGVYLFRLHSRPVCCLDWASPDSLISAAYDGSVRKFDVEKGVFEEIFATYDDTDSYYSGDLGYGLDQGYRYWVQHVSVDPRYSTSSPCLFAATSAGTAFHLDLRMKARERITFHEQLSEKKINTLSLHPNGNTMASAGLDGVVRLWDIRKLGDDRGGGRKKKTPSPFATQSVGLSISSSYFSPSGGSLLSTSFANRLDLINEPHKESGVMKPAHSVRHNNQTGRWLSTFMATWHPKIDMFVSGSMKKPRCVEVFDSSGDLSREMTGESLTSVMSRCCFHPSTKKIVLIGGNSSGRVIAVQ